MTPAELAALPIELLRDRLADSGKRDKVVTVKFTIGTARMIVEAADKIAGTSVSA